MTYRYYVTYFVASTNMKSAKVGRCFSQLDSELDTEETILELQHKLETDHGWYPDQVTLLDWKRIN